MGGQSEAVRSVRLWIAAVLIGVACGADTVDFDSFRGVRIGMTVPEAAAGFGVPLAPASFVPDDERSCYYVFPNGVVDTVTFMVVDERIARIDIDGPGLLTHAGVGVGSTEAEVLKAYASRATVEPHPYTAPEGHYIVIAPEGGRGAIFESDGARVLSFRVGETDAVRWIEGCL